jgi:FtsP/CotA-like multicopper oxidase with cupredoxin domain
MHNKALLALTLLFSLLWSAPLQKTGTMFYPSYSWQNPTITPSCPPPLTGKQMGTIETLGIKPLGYTKDGNVKVFHLIAQPIEQWMTDGISQHELVVPTLKQHYGMQHHMTTKQQLRAWGYNGTSPGPTIEATEGDTIRIILKNELPEPTSIHWHGIELPFAQDGAEGTKLTEPGQTGTYEFTLHQSGAYLYHSEFNISKQDAYGLSGMLIIHPKKYDKKVDRHIAILLQEWALAPGNPNPNLVTMDFNWFTFNGRVAPSIPLINVKQGERVRIYLGNMSMDSHPIHIHGHVWHVVGTEGGPIQPSAQIPGSTVNVPPGSTRTVEFVGWNPGLWRFHCHKLHHVMNAHAEVPLGIMDHGGMFTYVQIEAKDPQESWQHPSAEKPDNSTLDSYGFKKDTHEKN